MTPDFRTMSAVSLLVEDPNPSAGAATGDYERPGTEEKDLALPSAIANLEEDFVQLRRHLEATLSRAMQQAMMKATMDADKANFCFVPPDTGPRAPGLAPSRPLLPTLTTLTNPIQDIPELPQSMWAMRGCCGPQSRPQIIRAEFQQVPEGYQA